MKRLKVLLGQRRMQVLVALAAVVLAASIVIGSGANFTSASANPSNTFSAGTLKQLNSLNNAAILTATNMKPGGTPATGTVTITNNGTVAGHISLSTSLLTNTPGTNGGLLSSVLTLKIMDGATQVYSGPINAVGTVALPSAGTPTTTPWAAGEAHTYAFTVTFPDGSAPPSLTTGDNAYQGSSMSIQFDWTGTSN